MKTLFVLSVFLLISACSSTNAGIVIPIGSNCDCEAVGTVNKGTNTAVVKVSLDRTGMPYIDAKVVELEVGQRLVWVGPSRMIIRFPKASPFRTSNLRTKDGVINQVIPKQDFGEQNQLEFKYDVIVGDKVLDPIIIIKRPQGVSS
ncbi:hypothetical protein QTP81_12290 [Alteromonas sp. ASW11-36]|uniref:Uncharacterized protein n=1 Tax=Alteromonas arenosi TaxID=3055817 RepID=A0ABT7SYY3_9ALTE|nr:hypothetical protein [Alteromonas sp. ASW11-36]MDM7861376.1 hypothetical protein [Alteromonas sp. ASW11-36]